MNNSNYHNFTVLLIFISLLTVNTSNEIKDSLYIKIVG